MFHFSPRSDLHLSQCHSDIQAVAHEAIKYFDFSVIEGRRDAAKQSDYFVRGLSKLQYPNSKHNSNPSKAVHFAPFPYDDSSDPKNLARYYFLAGVILTIAKQMGVSLRWGGDWDGDGNYMDQSFDDLMHFELT